MERMEWNDDLSMGIKLINEQHKALMQKLCDVCVAVEL